MQQSSDVKYEIIHEIKRQLRIINPEKYNLSDEYLNKEPTNIFKLDVKVKGRDKRSQSKNKDNRRRNEIDKLLSEIKMLREFSRMYSGDVEKYKKYEITIAKEEERLIKLQGLYENTMG